MKLDADTVGFHDFTDFTEAVLPVLTSLKKKQINILLNNQKSFLTVYLVNLSKLSSSICSFVGVGEAPVQRV